MLAGYAVKVEDSRGRRIPEPPHAYRNDFQRDRDRVIHARAFRRLENKTQVFTGRYSDHFRNRLTHTIEVQQISRTTGMGPVVNEGKGCILFIISELRLKLNLFLSQLALFFQAPDELLLGEVAFVLAVLGQFECYVHLAEELTVLHTSQKIETETTEKASGEAQEDGLRA